MKTSFQYSFLKHSIHSKLLNTDMQYKQQM